MQDNFRLNVQYKLFSYEVIVKNYSHQKIFHLNFKIKRIFLQI